MSSTTLTLTKGWLRGKTLQQLGQQVGGDGRNDAQHDIALLVARHLEQLGLGFIQFAKNALRLWQEGLSEYRELGRTRQAVEQPRPQLRFEFQDLLRERRLRDMLHFGSAGKRAMPGDSAEIAKLMDFHGYPWSFLYKMHCLWKL